MLEMHANNREEIKQARAGDIVALCGLKVTPIPSHPLRPLVGLSGSVALQCRAFHQAWCGDERKPCSHPIALFG